MTLLHAVLLLGIISLSFAADSAIRWCTVSASEQQKCNELKSKMATDYPKFSCIRKDSHESCVNAIKSDQADAITLDGGDIYKGGLLPAPRLKPIAAENTTGESCYYAVAVVKKSSSFTINTLKGRKSCHTGLGKSAGWNIPIGTIVQRKGNEWNRNDPIEKSVFQEPVVNSLVYVSCVKDLEQINADDHTTNPTTIIQVHFSAPEPSGKECLKDGAGEVAFVKHTTVPAAERQNYKLLCLDGTTQPINNYKDCHWAKVPAHAVVVRSRDVDDAKNAAIWRFLSLAQKRFGPHTHGQFKIFSSEKYQRMDLMFKDATEELIHLPKETDYLLYLGTNYANSLKYIRKETDTPRSTLRWCTIGDTEKRKCDTWPSVKCVEGANAEDCIKQIMSGVADAVSLDGGQVYVGGKCGLVPVMAEYYNKIDRSPCGARSNIIPSYYAVAVVKNPQTTWESLRGKKSCHTGVGRTAGWNVPMGFLIKKNKIRACDVYNSTYFSDSCAPGADKTLHPHLCSLCIGTGKSLHSETKCDANSNEQYFSYSGAFRCLAEAGDVAFVKHTTVLENTSPLGQLDWNQDLQSSDYRLLCKDGTTAPIVQFATCNLATVPAHAVMTRPNMKQEVLELLKNEQLKYGREGLNKTTFNMFDSASFLGKDLLFKDSTQCLIDVTATDYKGFLGQSYIATLEGLHSCKTPELLEACSFVTC